MGQIREIQITQPSGTRQLEKLFSKLYKTHPIFSLSGFHPTFLKAVPKVLSSRVGTLHPKLHFCIAHCFPEHKKRGTQNVYKAVDRQIQYTSLPSRPYALPTTNACCDTEELHLFSLFHSMLFSIPHCGITQDPPPLYQARDLTNLPHSSHPSFHRSRLLFVQPNDPQNLYEAMKDEQAGLGRPLYPIIMPFMPALENGVSNCSIKHRQGP